MSSLQFIGVPFKWRDTQCDKFEVYRFGVFYPIEQQNKVQGKCQEESQEAQVIEVSGEVVLQRLDNL